MMLILGEFTGFDWDFGNDTKNWKRHHVTREECEQVFFRQPLFTFYDSRHSRREARYLAFGRTDSGRHLFVVFTSRGRRLRVISARDMTRAERRRFHAT